MNKRDDKKTGIELRYYSASITSLLRFSHAIVLLPINVMLLLLLLRQMTAAATVRG